MRIEAPWRYSVKSMQGESLAAAAVGAAGLLGDRAYAVVDAATGRVASAKHPRVWGALLACRATFVEPPSPGGPAAPVCVTLPDGARVRSEAPGVHAALSALLGRAVRLVTTQERDGAPGPVAPAPRHHVPAFAARVHFSRRRALA